MTKPQPSSVTAEEAVARLVNMDYIPDGCTLLEMTAAFLEEAEADFENAKLEPRSAAERDRLYRRVEICRCRDRLAEQLLADLRKELEAPDQSQITCTTDGTAITRVTTASVWQWAADRYGLGVPDWEPPTAATLPDDARWEDITIKIYADHRLGWSHKGEGWRTARFEDVGLMGKKHRSPNAQGVVLTALSAGRKFPATSQLSGNERTIMTRLRTSLRQLTGLRKGEPTAMDLQRSVGLKAVRCLHPRDARTLPGSE